MISLAILNPQKHTVSEEIMRNLLKLSKVMTQVEREYGELITVTSGYRTYEEQKETDPAHPRSAHCEGLAVDCADKDKELYSWCFDNADLMKHLGLYLEDGTYTPRHVHFQLKAPPSGHRFFIP